MKRFEEYTILDLIQLRNEIVLNSLLLDDYKNTLGVSPSSAFDFFDGYYDFLWEFAEEIGFIPSHEIAMSLDTSATLEKWYFHFENFDWVKYEE